MPQLPPVFMGFDKSGLPTGGGSAADGPLRRLAVAHWLFTHTNWRVAGGYPTIAASVHRPPGLENAAPYRHEMFDENRGWSTIYEDLWTHGWGVGIFAVVLSRKTFYHDVEKGPPVPSDVKRADKTKRPVTLRAYGRTPGPWNGGDFDTVNLAPELYADAAHTQPTVVLNAANGVLHGQFIKWLMSLRHPGLFSAVVYIDNEDSTWTFFSPDELAYYRALFVEMATRRPGQPALRPGIYAHGDRIPGDRNNARSVVAQLLTLYPELYVCQVTYNGGLGNKQLPTGPDGKPQDPRAGMNTFPTTNTDAALHSIAVPPGPFLAHTWTAWPVIKQWEGNNSSELPPGATAVLPFRGRSLQFAFPPLNKVNKANKVHIVRANQGWDFESATVPDPTYPAASPRLALGSAGRLCLLAIADRPDPPDDNTAASGRVTVYRIDDRGHLTQHGPSLLAPKNFVLLPGARLTWMGAYLVTLARPLATLECVPIAWRLTASRMSAPEVIEATRLPVHTPLGGGAIGSQLRIFGPAATGQLRSIVVSLSKAGVFTANDQASGHLFHPFTDIAAAQRKNNIIDVIGISENGALATTWWVANQNSQGAFTQIGAPGALLPSTRLALAPLGSDGLLALGVGADLRLTAAHWTAKAARWSAPYAVTTSQRYLLLPHTAIGLYTSSPTRAQALVMQSGAIPLVWSGPTLALYDLAPGRDGKWTQQGAAVDLGIPTANGAMSENTMYQKAPHPLSDLHLARAGARTIAAAVWIEPGKSRVWFASRPDSAGSDQRRGWTTWSAVAPPR